MTIEEYISSLKNGTPIIIKFYGEIDELCKATLTNKLRKAINNFFDYEFEVVNTKQKAGFIIIYVTERKTQC